MNKSNSMSRHPGIVTLACVMFAGLTTLCTSGCSSDPASPGAGSEEVNTAGMTFDEFMELVYQEPDTGVYIVNGDEPVTSLSELERIYLATVQQGALIVHQQSGTDARWSDAQKLNLSYCVSTGFGANYSSVVAAMNTAASAWEAAANVNFVHASSHDSNCTSSNNSVIFDVNPVGGQPYLARAFFPNDARSVRNVLIDSSAFGVIAPFTMTGILRHELGHALGFRHEHTRPEAGTCFEDSSWRQLTPYDAASVMHYPQCNGAQTGDMVLTNNDKQGAASLYGSPGGGTGLIPTMSGSTTPSGVVTRSGVYSSSYEAWQAFDGTGTLWLSNMYASSVWIAYEWGGGVTKNASSYEIKYANGSCCEQRGPKNWTLQGWNGATWVTVDTVTGQTGWYANPTRTFVIDTPGAYSKYRLNVTADNYNDPSSPITLVSIASIQLYGSAPGTTPTAQVPTMTSSTAPSGVVTRSGVYSSSYEAWQAFDGTGTLWLSNMYASSVWIAYEWGGGTTKVISSYELKYANGSCCEQRGPKNWTLQGWNGATWVTVDTVTGQTGWYANPTRTFAVDSPGAYSKYRLNVTADNYNDPSSPITLVSIASIQLYGY